MNRWYAAALGLLLFSTTACSKKVKLEDLDEELSAVQCGKIFECCSQAEIDAASNLFIDFSTEEECVSAYDNLIGLFLTSALKSAVDNGRADYDPKAAADCLAEFESASCEAVGLSDGGLACEEIIVPLVEDGGVCKQSFECKGGTCYMADFDANEGVCETKPGEDEDCREREMDGFTFTECADDLTCIDGKCTAPRAEGAACENGSECDSGICDFDTQKCAPLKADGEECFYGGECASGACDEETSKCTQAAASGEGCGIL